MILRSSLLLPPTMPSDTKGKVLRWPECPTELLEVISQKVTSIHDYIRFRSVCRSWRSAATQLPPLQRPLLMLSGSSASSLCAVRSLSTDLLFMVDLPEVRQRTIIGTSHGWLILLCTKSDIQISLLNPMTGSLIRLPPIEDTSLPLPHEAFLSSSPTGAGCIVMVRFKASCSYIAFCRLEDAAWTKLDTQLRDPLTVTYHKRQFYVMDSGGLTAILNESRPTLPRFIDPPPHASSNDKFFLRWISGELLLISLLGGGGTFSCCHVFKLDLGSRVCRWSKMESMLATPVRNRVYGWRACRKEGNCIYFAGRGKYRYSILRLEGDDTQVQSAYDLAKGLLGPTSIVGWFTPSLC